MYGDEYIYAAQKEVSHVVASFCVRKNEYLEPYKHWYVIPPPMNVVLNIIHDL